MRRPSVSGHRLHFPEHSYVEIMHKTEKSVDTGRFSGASVVISWPSTRICPSSVFKNPLIILSVVVFPQPDAPRRHNSSPFGRESDKSFTTSFSPKLLLMLFQF